MGPLDPVSQRPHILCLHLPHMVDISSKIKHVALRILELFRSLYSSYKNAFFSFYLPFLQLKNVPIDARRLEQMTADNFLKDLDIQYPKTQRDKEILEGYFRVYAQTQEHRDALIERFPELSFNWWHPGQIFNSILDVIFEQKFAVILEELNQAGFWYEIDTTSPNKKIIFYGEEISSLFDSLQIPYERNEEGFSDIYLNKEKLLTLYEKIQHHKELLLTWKQQLSSYYSSIGFQKVEGMLFSYRMVVDLKATELTSFNQLLSYIKKEEVNILHVSPPLSIKDLEKLTSIFTTRDSISTSFINKLKLISIEENVSVQQTDLPPHLVAIETDSIKIKNFLSVFAATLKLPFKEGRYAFPIDVLSQSLPLLDSLRYMRKGQSHETYHGMVLRMYQRKEQEKLKEWLTSLGKTYHLDLTSTQLTCQRVFGAVDSFEAVEQAKQQTLQHFFKEAVACGPKAWIQPIDIIPPATIRGLFGRSFSFEEVCSHFEQIPCFRRWQENPAFVTSYTKFKERAGPFLGDIPLQIWARTVYRLARTELGQSLSAQTALYKAFLAESDEKEGWYGCDHGFLSRLQILEDTLKGGDGTNPLLSLKFELTQFCWTLLGNEDEAVGARINFDQVISRAIGLGLEETPGREPDSNLAPLAIEFIQTHLFPYDLFLAYHTASLKQLTSIQKEGNHSEAYIDWLRSSFALSEEEIIHSYCDQETYEWDVVSIEQDLPKLILLKLFREGLLARKGYSYRSSHAPMLQRASRRLSPADLQKWQMAEQEGTFQAHFIDRSTVHLYSPWAGFLPQRFKERGTLWPSL